MLQVHFTAEDLVRVRVAAAPDPLWEITHSFQLLMAREVPPVFREWHRLVRPRLPRSSALLAALLPPRGYSPDFLTPDLGDRLGLEQSAALEEAVELVLGTPRAVLRRDLARLAASPGRLPARPGAVRHLAEGAPESLHELGAALRAYYRSALAPFWPHIRAHVDADRAVRARAVLRGGTAGLLDGFRPVLRWEPPLLRADYPVARDLRLEGRGLLLQPSFFCVRRPVTLADPGMAPVLVYPVQHTPGRPPRRIRGGAERPRARLDALIGRTRAAILEDVATGRTTGELAQRFSVSEAAASYHTAVLRRAGLLLSVRRSRHVVHTITPAGLALLNGPLDGPFGSPFSSPLDA
ncbi:winged helix-turn-helix domain-containing protein [Streptomyces albiaxialis]|uniref:Winged helix-turn-helix domain-containing protein n=1 Tax=Streptomyces albiaxialis TaxID=329523 RepID=A0ABN2VRF9_9ACTN